MTLIKPITARRTIIDDGSVWQMSGAGLIHNKELVRSPEEKFRWCVVKIGSEFHTETMQWNGGDVWYAAIKDHHHETVVVYQPIHPGMVDEDIIGATYAHDTGTHWKFAHCSPHQQIDFAADAEQFCYAAFQEQIHRALNSGQTGANTKARALMDFASQAGREVFNTVRRATLGEYHRNPHQDHRRDLAHAAVVKVWTAWLKNASRVTDRTAISSIVGSVGQLLATDYTIEWRDTRAPIWAAAGRDPVSGREWCYTLAATSAEITGAANLPDPAWHFDAFPTKGIAKGSQVYHDGQPTPTEEKPWVIRFSRPVAIAPGPGVSIGSVPWVQEEAFKPS